MLLFNGTMKINDTNMLKSDKTQVETYASSNNLINNNYNDISYAHVQVIKSDSHLKKLKQFLSYGKLYDMG